MSGTATAMNLGRLLTQTARRLPGRTALVWGERWWTWAELDARVVAVSVDSPWVLERFKREIGANYLFLSDFNRAAIQAYDVVRKTPVGPGLMGVSERAAFVIGTDGCIRYAWSSTTPGLLPPFDEIKQALNGSA